MTRAADVAARSLTRRNALINGSFNHWQRATSASLTGTTSYVAPDRWAAVVAGGGTGTGIWRVDNPMSGVRHGVQFGRTASETNTNPIYIVQCLEGKDSIPLAGKKVTLSFIATGGSDFSASGAILNSVIDFGTAEDDTAANQFGLWAGQTSDSKAHVIPLSAWGTVFSHTATVPANTKQVGVRFYWTPTGTAGANDHAYMTNVQLEVGESASPFEALPVGEELSLCERYYYKTSTAVNAMPTWYGYVSNTQAFGCSFPHPTTMRVAPTLAVSGTWGTGGTAATQPTLSGQDTYGLLAYCVANVTGYGYFHPNGSGYYTATAEL